MQQQLANVLKQAGDGEGAERSYRQMLEQAPPEMQFQAVTSYANFLGETERAPQGLRLMQDYLTGGTAPQHEASMALFTLSQLARRAGDSKLADEYQKSAMAKQPPRQEEKDRNLINPYFQKAQAAANAGRVDEGFALAMEAMSSAWNATDRNRIVGFVASVATALANRTPHRDQKSYEKASEKAAQLFDRLFILVDSWSGQTRQPLLNVREYYVQFLMHPDRQDKADDAIARYREAVIAARGEGSGWLEKVLQLKLQLADQSKQPERRLALARDLVQLEESLSGKTSDAYIRAVQMLANIYQNCGDPERALPLFLQAVAIADLALEKGDSQRGYARTQAAYTLARLGRFDEAEKLIDEAVAIKLRPPQPGLFRSQAEEIQRVTGGVSVGVNLDIARGNVDLAARISRSWSERAEARAPS
jgi:tetratricopeptide (TPR) repeat protein